MTTDLRSTSSSRLRYGFTTGACAAAATSGAAQMLLLQRVVTEATIQLPGGVPATFALHGQTFTAESASCFVVKDAGDDPDVTNGAEIHATVAVRNKGQESAVVIEGGVGIGRITKPGLAIPPGKWAINPVPLQMIGQAVHDVLTLHPSPFSLGVTISIPDGEERAKKTLNSRLGIIGGLSILGTTGIVRPISAKAWTDTIDSALDVAKACGCKSVVLSTGRSSEMAAQEFLKTVAQKPTAEDSGLPPGSYPGILPEEAYIMMGDHVAYALQACAKRGFMEPVIACQFAKLLKIACGHQNTHAAASELDLAILQGWAEEEVLPPELIEQIDSANTAREIAVSSGFDNRLVKLVINRARTAAIGHAPGINVKPLLCKYDGSVVR